MPTITGFKRLDRPLDHCYICGKEDAEVRVSIMEEETTVRFLVCEGCARLDAGFLWDRIMESKGRLCDIQA